MTWNEWTNRGRFYQLVNVFPICFRASSEDRWSAPQVEVYVLSDRQRQLFLEERQNCCP